MIETTSVTDHISMAVDTTEPRQTPPPPGRRFAEALRTGVGLLVSHAGEAAGALPGGTILAAATRTVAAGDDGITAAAGERPEGPGGTGVGDGGSSGTGLDEYWKLQQQSQEFNLQYLQLQEGLSQENRRFSTLSNVLKARHDTSKAVIQNIR